MGANNQLPHLLLLQLLNKVELAQLQSRRLLIAESMLRKELPESVVDKVLVVLVKVGSVRITCLILTRESMRSRFAKIKDSLVLIPTNLVETGDINADSLETEILPTRLVVL